MGRIEEICSRIPQSEIFADIGCDHGYCTRYVLEHDLCKTAYISDISEGSLQKARRLLSLYIARGRCIPVCADGLRGIHVADTVLVAGLGGEEIIRILSEKPLPERFVLQPMRNSDKLRAYLIERGAKITLDYTFADGGYFYDLISGEGAGGDTYTEHELLFGRDNLKNPSQAFRDKLKEERQKIRERLDTVMQTASRDALLKKLYTIEVITDAIEGDL